MKLRAVLMATALLGSVLVIPAARAQQQPSPEVLKACVPGAQEVVGDPETGYTATVVQKVGPVKATFKHIVLLTDGISEEGDSISLAQEASRNKVTISTVGLGQSLCHHGHLDSARSVE